MENFFCWNASYSKKYLSQSKWKGLYQFVSGDVLHCGAKHDGDENVARNILVAGGHTETKNGQVGQHKTTAKVAAACEMSTRRRAKARYETQCL